MAATYSQAGDAITYQIVVVNTGNITLSGVTITDPMLGTLACAPVQPASLAPGAALTCLGSYTVTQADVDAGSVFNIATAVSDQTGPESDDVIVIGTQNPDLAIDKVATTLTYNSVGDEIDYEIFATNIGNVTLTGVTITDPLLGTLACTPLQPASLAPNGVLTCSGSYTVTQADLDRGFVDNTATADSNQTGLVSDTETVTGVQLPALTVNKTATPSFYDAVNDVISYTIVATNTGNVTLHNVAIADAQLGTLVCTPTQPATLIPGGTLTCTGTHNITQADLDAGSYANTATANSDETLPVTDDELVVAEGNPLLGIDKTTTTQTYNSVGDLIDYQIVATNLGNVTLSGVTITDPMLGTLVCTPTQPATLIPGETLFCTGSYAVTQADLDAGSVNNIATAEFSGNRSGNG